MSELGRAGIKMLDILQKFIVPLLLALFYHIVEIRQDVGDLSGKLSSLHRETELHWNRYDLALDEIPSLKNLMTNNALQIQDLHLDINKFSEEQTRRTDTINYMEALKEAGGWPLTSPGVNFNDRKN